MIADEDRCEAEVTRIVRGPDRHRYEYRRCPNRAVEQNNGMYPSSRAVGGMDSESGQVCRRHTDYLQTKWKADFDD